MLMAGALVCFEGIDGAGKNTQSTLLVKKMQERGRRVSLHSYPDYGSRYGKIIREFLDGKINLDVNELFLLYLLDMVKDKREINEELSRGDIVVMDRYFITTIAYQCAGGFDYGDARKIEEVMRLPVPSLTVYLDVSVDVSLERKLRQKGHADRFEQNKQYLSKVKEMYDRLYSEKYSGAVWTRIDATERPEGIHEKVLGMMALDKAQV